MKRTLLFSIIVAGAATMMAGGRETAAAADSAYAAEDYQQAIAGYEHVINSGEVSGKLLYNLGNAYWRDGRPGKAVVAYERSLKLDPTNDDTRTNLQFVRSHLVDKQTESKNAIDMFFDSLRDFLTPNGWAWTGIGLFALFIALAAIYLFTSPVAARKIGFFGGLAALPLSIGAFALAVSGSNAAQRHDEAVVTSTSVMLGAAPRQPKDRNEEVALLHEGTKIQVLDSLVNRSDSVAEKWLKVKLPSGHQGWTSANGLEII